MNENACLKIEHKKIHFMKKKKCEFVSKHFAFHSDDEHREWIISEKTSFFVVRCTLSYDS